MFVRIIKKPNDHVSIRIVENVRENGKVKQKTICGVGHFHSSNTAKIESHKKIAEDLIIKIKNDLFPALPGMEEILYAPSKKAPPKSEAFKEETINPKTTIEEKRINQGIHDIFGHLYQQLNFDSLLKDSSSGEILKQIVLARIALPSSKLKTCKILERDFNQEFPIQQVYRMMDKLVPEEINIKKLCLNATTNLLNQTVNVLFFDVTTLYFESQTSDELRANGFSKDCKFKEVQVVMALATTVEGLPIWYKEFRGNTSEGSTLIKMVEEMRQEFTHVNEITFVADRAMFNKMNLKKLEEMGVKYVVAAKLRSLSKGLKEKILTSKYKPTTCDEEFIWADNFEWENQRLVVSYSSKRAKKDKNDRERLLERLEKKKNNQGELVIDQLISNLGTKKFIKKTKSKTMMSEEKILCDAQWDGMHGVITNIKDENLESILSKYKSLWQIEAAFRLNKNDLRMRPIYHWKERRIKAHFLICYLSYTLASIVKFRLKQNGINLSFEIIRDELIKSEASLLFDKRSRKKILLPSQSTENQRKIYEAFGLVKQEKMIRQM